jgi:hypothetical protein
MDGVNDLGVVDAAQVDRGDPKVGVSELPLNYHQRYAFSGHFHGVCMPELVRRESSPHASVGGGVAQLDADSGR